uniref:Zgc:193801 n=1 Tax=Hucho hucho TaxID=62062 RepID=A0A4W5Q8E7_9TELE
MSAFIAHPSVRIRGTEHTYNPVLCQDDNCSGKDKGTHTHCPFCTVAEAYQDPVILLAHYRIKHVDKGIDFAGLIVLRCCNHCEIVGTIKGEKRFKGAHWHCYRCRNGFNRRDEAIKHYKTHFRNPHTTFQIQVTQEVNSRQYYDQNPEAQPKAYGGLEVCSGAEGGTVGTIVAQPVLNTEALLTVERKDSSVNNRILVVAEGEVGPSQHTMDRTQTLVLMDPDGQGGNLNYEEAASIIAEQGREGLEQALQMEKHLLELHRQNETLQQEKDAMEKRLRAEIQRLNEQVAGVVQANVKMFEELKLYRSAENSQQRIDQLVKSLEKQHRALIHTQLASLRTELLRQAGTAAPINGHSELTVSLIGEEATGPGEMTLLKEEPSETRVDGEGGALTMVVVQMDPDPGDLVSISGDVCLVAGQEAESSVPELYSVDSGAEGFQNSTEGLEDKDGSSPSLSRKRRPKEEPGEEREAKMQCIC